MADLVIRPAATADAAAITAIYRPIVEETVISFELVAPTVAEIAGRIERISASHCWLVAEAGGAVAGYAYASGHREREAYRHSVEVSVYMHEDFRGRGIGRTLYHHLFDALQPSDYFHAYAGITIPNPGSIALHESVGFTHAGTFPDVGFKFGAWHDVGWWYRKIKDGVPG